MATTSPDNLYSPDSSDPYALTQDLGAMQDSVQSALVRRANAYVGTSAQRNAFTTAPVGTIWSDTNGSRLVYKRGASSWEPITPPVEDTGWVSVTLSGGWTAPQAFQMRRIGSVVYSRGSLLNSSFNNTTFTTMGNIPSGLPNPPSDVIVRLGSNSDSTMSLRVTTGGLIQAWRNSVSAAYWGVTPVSYVV